MTIEESNLTFEFDSDTHAVKFDDTEFYQKYFKQRCQGRADVC